MNWPNEERWKKLWQSAGAPTAPSAWYRRLTVAYAEPQRHYHNQQHIAECLAEFDQVRQLAQQPIAVELSLWFHDAVYDPKAGDNEEQSAALAQTCISEARLGKAVIEKVTGLIIATKAHEVGNDADAALMIDIDLSILGRERKRFFEYEDAIRKEYEWVPKDVFVSKRAEILERFLARKNIFTTGWFRDKYEQAARRNLGESISRLRKSP